MRRQTFSHNMGWLTILILVITLSCSLLNSTAPKRSTPQPTVSPTGQEQPTSPLQDILVDYVYTSNLITIIYPLYGSVLDDFSIVTLTNTLSTPAQAIVESEIIGYTTKSIDTVTIEPGESVEVRQNPLLIPEVIDELNVQKPAQFHLKVSRLESGEQHTILEETGDTLVYARRDFPWSIPGFTDQEVFELLAAMVTPNDPSVEELIRTAADYTSSGSMWSGYGDQLNDEDWEVWERLEAIWKAEDEDYHLTYISTHVSFAPGSVQRIRLPAEVLEQRSGNCIETTLLFASAAEALDLEAAIIGIPGHSFVGVRLDQENDIYYFIETTVIGKASFQEAVDLGKEEFDEALPHLDAEESEYGWLSVWDAREKGILPLPWH